MLSPLSAKIISPTTDQGQEGVSPLVLAEVAVLPAKAG